MAAIDRGEFLASLEEEEPSLERARKLTTFGGYARAWVIGLMDSVMVGADKLPDVARAMRANGQSAGLRQRSRTKSELEETRAHFQRGRITTIMMRLLPVEEDPAAATAAAMWIPVQAYYAVHGAGLAALTALNGTPPRDHVAFRRAVATIVQTRFPAPLNTSCRAAAGDIRRDELRRSPVTVSQADAASALSRVNSANAAALIAKSLTTTRQELVEIGKIDARRRLSKGRKKLSSSQVDDCWGRCSETTVVDFLWRLRCRSNYDQPEMFLAASDRQDVATGFCTDIRKLAECVARGFDAITEASLGPEQFRRCQLETETILQGIARADEEVW